MDQKVLYQIKNLDKMIFRCIFNGSNIDDDCSIKNMKMPTQTQMQIIAYIIKHKNEEVYQKDLEEVLNLRRATVSGVLHTMEKNNLIKRVTDSKDTRTKKIILDDKAKNIFDQNQKKIEKLEEIIITDIPKEEMEVFMKVIKKMKDNINQYAIECEDNN